MLVIKLYVSPRQSRHNDDTRLRAENLPCIILVNVP